MAGNVVIRAEGLGKKYVIGHQTERERYVALRDVIARQARRFACSSLDFVRGRGVSPSSTTEEFWALRDVSFEITRGEVVGVIGRNGAGKSTLLKVLSRITEPSAGRVTIEGRVASLLEIGTGFHPELTGRENIFLNGAVLGMARAEIRRKFDQIVAFAEVERFLDTPVKRYSSGMYVRLAFGVAAHLDPEIIIVDEVLAVGDAEFQKKCLGKMSEIAGAGRTVLFVSHNMAAIQALCPRTIHLDSGLIVGKGVTAQIISQYLENPLSRMGHAQASSVRVQDGLVLESLKCSPEVIRPMESLDIEMTFHAERPGRIRDCHLFIYSANGVRVAIIDVRESGSIPFSYMTGQINIRAQINSVTLIEGVYALGACLTTDGFAGDLFDLSHFTIGASKSHKYVPVPVEHRGFVTISAAVSISSRHIEINEAMSKVQRSRH
jgi:ABC-type polysaccharide/polyol phosphate transport system ATPase subunit